MKKSTYRLLCLLIVAALAAMPTVAFADEGISIATVEFAQFENGEDTDLVSTAVQYTAPEGTDEVTLLLASEVITDSEDPSQVDKIIHIDQLPAESAATLEFPISKQAIQDATGLADVNGCTLYMMMGGTDISEATVFPVVFADPYAEEQEEVRDNRLIGDLDGNLVRNAKDVTILRRAIASGVLNEGDLYISDLDRNGLRVAKDVTILRRFVAGQYTLIPAASAVEVAWMLTGAGKDDVVSADEVYGNYGAVVEFDWGLLK